MPDKKRVDVIIDGRNFTIVGEEDEEYIRNLAYYVDVKIRTLALKNSRLSQTMTATLAAIHIADELHEVKNDLNELRQKTRDPLEKYEVLNKDLKKEKDRIKELEFENKEQLVEISSIKTERDKALKELEQYKEESLMKEEEIQAFKKQLQDLQDKNFKGQIELIETKKELTDYMRLIDEETSIYSKEKN